MRKFFGMTCVALFALILGCGGGSDAEDETTPADTAGLYATVEVSAPVSREEYNRLRDEFYDLRDELWLVRKYRDVIALAVADRALDRAERGEDPGGSFSDFVVPALMDAYVAGAAESEIEKRLHRIGRLERAGVEDAEEGYARSVFARYQEDLEQE
jgi:hypothetical protein